MNKELIKKYQKEFISWVNGEELLIKGSNGWTTVGDDFNWCEPTDSVIVLKDKYFEFRIALTEGKSIQFYELVDEDEFDSAKDIYKWVDWKGATSASCFTSTLKYRIKPDDLKFKVGDIAIHNGKFRKISKVIDGMLDCFTDGPAVIMKNDTLEIWRPKVGEFCLFSNKGEKPIIGTFLEMFNGDLYVMAECKINAFEFCEPINCAYNCEKAPRKEEI